MYIMIVVLCFLTWGIRLKAHTIIFTPIINISVNYWCCGCNKKSLKIQKEYLETELTFWKMHTWLIPLRKMGEHRNGSELYPFMNTWRMNKNTTNICFAIIMQNMSSLRFRSTCSLVGFYYDRGILFLDFRYSIESSYNYNYPYNKHISKLLMMWV
jgi:hypothetical protein